MEDYDQVLRAVGYFTHRHGKIDRIDSFSEYWLDLEARVRTDFNIFGLREGTIEPLKRKSLMKERFIQAGVAVARGNVILNPEHARSFVKKVGYPVVAKPDRGVGALNTYKLQSDADLEAFFRTKPDVDYIFEEFVSGDIASFDGLTDRDGNVVFYTGHAYASGIMEVVNEDRHIYYYSYRDIPADLEEAGMQTVKAFDVRERFFHIEFFRRHHDNKIVALEINMRPPGGYTTDMYNYANDINIYREWANVVVHNEFRASYSRRYHCCYIGRKSGRPYLRSHDQVLQRLAHLIVHHTPVSGIFRSALGDYGYLIRSEDLAEIQDAITYVHGMGEERP